MGRRKSGVLDRDAFVDDGETLDGDLWCEKRMMTNSDGRTAVMPTLMVVRPSRIFWGVIVANGLLFRSQAVLRDPPRSIEPRAVRP